MKKIYLLFALIGFVTNFSSVNAFAAASPSASDLLKSSDRARGGLLKGLVWNVSLESNEDGVASTRSFEVRARDANALVQATAPARNKGEIFLFVGHDLWFVKPGLRKPVAISARERLSGQAANGDIASTRYSADYDATIAGKGQVDSQKVYILNLKAKDPKATYDQIRYYVSESSKLAIKAEFLTLQGQVMKIATFEYKNKIRVGGESLPFVSKMTIKDAKFENNQSVISYSDPVEKEIPASSFNVNNVAR